MLYTVKDVSSLSSVTIKTLHHYHKIGLLMPIEISEAGYRLYGIKELERLQQILFYKELDFSLEQIKQLLDGNPDRFSVLSQQEELLLARKQRLETIIQTLRKSMASMETGDALDNQDLFRGFESEEKWKEALSDQNQYLKGTYDFDMLDSAQIDVQNMNEQAREAVGFMDRMAVALRSGIKHNTEEVQQLIRSHLDFLNEQGHNLSPSDFAWQTQFFLDDEFHHQMLESQQTGLAYFLAAAAQSYSRS